MNAGIIWWSLQCRLSGGCHLPLWVWIFLGVLLVLMLVLLVIGVVNIVKLTKEIHQDRRS